MSGHEEVSFRVGDEEFVPLVMTNLHFCLVFKNVQSLSVYESLHQLRLDHWNKVSRLFQDVEVSFVHLADVLEQSAIVMEALRSTLNLPHEVS